MHYQAYLLEGLTRWNQDRALAARQQPQELHYRTYDLRLADSVSLWLKKKKTLIQYMWIYSSTA